jgi:alpha-L-fucosidase-like protein/glycosyl hydrolase family 42 (putative beta-galactosidase)
MRIDRCVSVTLLLIVPAFVVTAVPGLAEEQSGAAATAPDCWLKTPTVSVMTGFIYEPLVPYTIQEWMENLGNRFDADQWVKDFQDCGATHLVFYDKWIDGLVFHDTKTTNFKTKRDFVRELAAACQREGLPLVLYFNALSDGNPEFDEWATLDKQGKPIVFGAQWPTRYQTLHSPFRKKAVEQVRELLTDYGPIHGIWHDIFRERLDTSSPWVAKGYQEMFGQPFDEASPARLVEFNARTLAGYLDEVSAIRTAERQEHCLFTANGSGAAFLAADVWTDQVGSRLEYLFNEGHHFARNDELAQMAWVLPKPLDINFKLGSSWFTPLEDTPPPVRLTEKQAVAGTAIAVCQGAGVSWALTPGHSGIFGEDIQRAKTVGKWFRRVKPYLDGARPYADVAVVLGTPAAGGPGLPGANPFWTRYQGKRQSAWQSTIGISKALSRQGVFSRLLYTSAEGGSWPDSLEMFRAVIVPETAVLDEAHLDQLRRYVANGGRLIAFGHASLLDEKSQRRKDYGLGDVLGVRFAGEVAFPAESQSTVIEVDSELKRTFGGSPIVWRPRAVNVEATTAKIVASLQAKDSAAAILKNRFKAGEAYLITTTDGALDADDPFWTGLARLAAGQPTLSVKAEDARRYRIIATRIDDAHVIHVIDSQTDLPGSPPRKVPISLLSARLGNFQTATLVGSNEPLEISAEGPMISFTVEPDPVASVILR